MPGIRKVVKYMLDEKECIDYMRRKGLLKQDHHCCSDVCSKIMDISVRQGNFSVHIVTGIIQLDKGLFGHVQNCF